MDRNYVTASHPMYLIYFKANKYDDDDVASDVLLRRRQ